MKREYKQNMLAASILICSAIVAGCGDSDDQDIVEEVQSGANFAPTISGEPAAYVQASKEYRFVPEAEDVDGDLLGFSVENLPDWAEFNETNGAITGIPGELDVGEYKGITVSVSDGEESTALHPFAIDVLDPPLSRKSINTEYASVIENAAGYETEGDVTIQSGDKTTELLDAHLSFEFDAGDNLVNITGTAQLPASIGDYLQIENPLSVRVGLYTGAEINQDPDIGIDSVGGIRLLDEFNYLVFFLGLDMGITFKDKNNDNQVPITLGIGEAQNLIILDLTDPFSYAFGYLNGLGFGKGQSEHGLIPYVPNFVDEPDAFAELDSFSGHQVEKGIFPVGVKVFDLLSLSGSRVIRNPQFSDIDWQEPMNSSIHYQAGYSGKADFEFGVLGIGLFSYQLAEMSATFDVGLQRQQFAMQGVYQPTETSQPVWLPLRPSPEPFDKVVANISANGQGEFVMELRGQFQSSFPEAKIYGSMVQTLDGLDMEGKIDDDVNPIYLNAHADSSVFSATVNYSVDLNDQLQSEVLSEMDNQVAEVQTAVDDLINAIAGFEFAVSLEGLRDQLPVIADTAIAELNKIPATVSSSVYNSVLSYINNGEYCVTVIWETCYQYRDYVNETAIANTAASNTRDKAEAAIAPIIDALNDMKFYANQADAEALRVALKTALLEVYSYRTFTRQISYNLSRSINILDLYTVNINRTFNYTIDITVIPPELAELILTAANNVDKIPTAYEVMINISDFVDSLPTEQAIESARQDLQDGLAMVPSFDGAGYSVRKDGDSTAYIILNGEKKQVEFNLLDTTNAAIKIIHYITREMINL